MAGSSEGASSGSCAMSRKAPRPGMRRAGQRIGGDEGERDADDRADDADRDAVPDRGRQRRIAEIGEEIRQADEASVRLLERLRQERVERQHDGDGEPADQDDQQSRRASYRRATCAGARPPGGAERLARRVERAGSGAHARPLIAARPSVKTRSRSGGSAMRIVRPGATPRSRTSLIETSAAMLSLVPGTCKRGGEMVADELHDADRRVERVAVAHADAAHDDVLRPQAHGDGRAGLERQRAVELEHRALHVDPVRARKAAGQEIHLADEIGDEGASPAARRSPSACRPDRSGPCS